VFGSWFYVVTLVTNFFLIIETKFLKLIYLKMKVVSVFLYILGRFSPYEWKKDDDTSDDGALVLKNQFTLKDTFWYILGGLLKQGTDISPK